MQRLSPLCLAALLPLAALALPPAPDAGPPQAEQAAPRAPALPDEVVAPDEAALQQQVAQIVAQERVAGAAVALVSREKTLVLSGFGLSDAAGVHEVRPSTPFSAGPLSPLFVALTALRVAAVEEQAAQMDPHLLEHQNEGNAPEAEARQPLLRLPLDAQKLGLETPFAATAALRMEHLLEQTAGLEDLAPVDRMPAPVSNPPLRSVLALHERKVRWPPGSRFSPSRTSFTAAALQLEQWGQTSFAALAEAEVLRPLGLSCTSFRPGEALLRDLAPGHLAGRPHEAPPQLHWPAQGLVSCAQDLAVVLRMLLERGRSEAGTLHGQQLVPARVIDRMRAGVSLGLPPSVVVSGLGTQSVVLDGAQGSGQSGTLEGSAAELYWFARAGIGYAVLLSSESPVALARIAGVVRRFGLKGMAQPVLEPPVPEPLLAQAGGTWTQVASPDRLRAPLDELFGFAAVEPEGQTALSYSFSLGAAQKYYSFGGGALRLETGPLPSAALVQREAARGGQLELITPDGTFHKAFGPWVYLRLVLLGAALLGLFCSALFALVWGPRALFGKLRGAPDLAQRTLPALSAVVLGEWLLLWARGQQPLGALNLTSALLWALGPLYLGLSAAGLWLALRRPAAQAAPAGPAVQVHVEGALAPAPAPPPSRAARAVRAFCLTVSGLALFLGLELLAYGLIGVRTWR
jgi:CubicO group peptidase (beta-lactamase class C family)